MWGFSLVEVTIALGIVAFAVVASIGVLPVGLQSVRESMDDGARRAIFSEVRAELASLGRGELDAVSVERYFDHEGREVGSSADSRFSLDLQTAAPAYPGVNFDDGVPATKFGRAVAMRLDARQDDTGSAFALVLPENGR